MPTVVSSHQEGLATQKVLNARKSTPSSGFKTISSSGCTKVSESSTPTDIYTNNPIPKGEGPPLLRRSTRSSSKLLTKSSKEPSRRKSTRNTVGSSKPPPLEFNPFIKIETVDVNGGGAGMVSATFDTISGFTLTTPSEETEVDELKPSALQPRELHTNELQPNEIIALHFKRNTDTIYSYSSINPPYNPRISTASTIHPLDNPSVSTAFTIHSPDKPSISTNSTIQPPDYPSFSTASTELPSYETVRFSEQAIKKRARNTITLQRYFS